MKKFAFTLALALICLLSAAQQPHKTLKERMEHGLSIEQIKESMQNRLNYILRFDSLVDIHGNGKKTIKYAYDDHARLAERIEVTQRTYTDTVEVNSLKNTYVFDENDNCILATQYEWWDGNWNEIKKGELTFDANGNCLSRILSSYGEPTRKYLWTYDDDSHCLSEEHWEYNSNHWETFYRYEYGYDAQGKMTLRIRQDSDTFDSWKNTSKDEYYYGANGNETLYIYSKWSSENQDWEERSRTIHTYDANNNLTVLETIGDYAEMIEYIYDEANRLKITTIKRDIDGVWKYIFKTEYEYDQNDSILLDAFYRGPSPEYGPDWRKERKTEYVRNEAGYVTCKTESKGSSDSENEWIYLSRILYEYNDYNQLTQIACLGWRSTVNDFVCLKKYDYTFDENKNTKSYHYSYYNSVNDEWTLGESFESTYDLNTEAAYILGLPLIYKEINHPYTESPVQNKWLTGQRYSDLLYEEHFYTLYYSDYYAVNDNESSSLKAYSTNGMLAVENDVVTDIQVFDMLGRLVAQQNQVAQCKFNLKPGVYVVKAGNASVKVVVK